MIQTFPQIKSLLPLVRPYSHNKQSVPMNWFCADCVLSLGAEVKAEKDTKVVPCKWYSEDKYKVNCYGVKVDEKHIETNYSK